MKEVNMEENIQLVKAMYPCQDVPVVVFGNRCPKACLYCDLYKSECLEDNIIASGVQEVLAALPLFKGAYFSAVSDCFLNSNKKLTHYLIENIWKKNKNFVPLIVTKQVIPKETIKLLIKNKHRVVIQVSINSMNNEFVSALEPGTASIAERLEMIRQLTEGGVSVTAVVMPWFDVYDKGESIDLLPKQLVEVGISRCIIGTGILPEEQKKLMLSFQNCLIVEAAEKMTEEHKVTTKTGYTLPFDDRTSAFGRLIEAFHNVGIKSRICTADNPDLINKTTLPLCTVFKHPLFH